MNNSEITSLLKDYLIEDIFSSSNEVLNATTNLQLADKNSLCFYNIADSEDALTLFLERLKNSECRNLILSRPIELEGINVWVVLYEDFLKTQELISDLLYPNRNVIKIAGITGTNGKTTVSYLAMQLATALGYPSLSIGTIGIRSAEKILENDILSTTPSYLELRKIVYKYQEKYKFLFIEVSSHALAQDRLYNVEIECCAWTSFSQDHLDYHKDYNDYFNAKLKIINNSKDKNIIVPSSELKLIQKLEDRGLSVIKVDPIYNSKIDIGFKATYNQANLGVAKKLVECMSLEVIEDTILEQVALPSGRFESIIYGENIVIIDYAHTPDALINICETIKNDFLKYKLKVVFGCGGDRDKSKRPLMGAAVAKFADSIIVTSDNPRTEQAIDIINDILPGIDIPFEKEVDRKRAISLSLSNLKNKTVILIAGKGHEEYQDIMGVKSHFSDKEEVLRFIKENENV